VFVPYRVDVPFDHSPVVNRLVCAVVILMFCLQVVDFISAANRRDPYEQQQQMARRQAEEELETGPPKWPKPEPPDDFIRFRCFCGQKIKVPRVHAGRMGRCPGCSKRVKVPEQ